MAYDLMETWLRGYCVARGSQEPEVVPEGFWIEVGKPQQTGRFILHRFDPAAITRLIDKITEPAIYIEFPGATAYTLPLLPDGWRIRDDAYLMRRSLLTIEPAEAKEVDGYAFTEHLTRAGLEAVVRTAGLAGMLCGNRGRRSVRPGQHGTSTPTSGPWHSRTHQANPSRGHQGFETRIAGSNGGGEGGSTRARDGQK